MKKPSYSLAISVAVLLVTATMLTAETIVVEGTVLKTGQIVTDEGKVYTIAKNDLRDKLVKEVEKDVKATGEVTTDEWGNKLLAVSSYQVVAKKSEED